MRFNNCFKKILTKEVSRLNKTFVLKNKEYEFDFIWDEAQAKQHYEDYLTKKESFEHKRKQNKVIIAVIAIALSFFLLFSGISTIINYHLLYLILFFVGVIASILSAIYLGYRTAFIDLLEPEEFTSEFMFYRKTNGFKILEINPVSSQTLNSIVQFEFVLLRDDDFIKRITHTFDYYENITASKVILNAHSGILILPYEMKEPEKEEILNE